ncbi:hypothetical protein D3C81_1001580 [compost metagenome]
MQLLDPHGGVTVLVQAGAITRQLDARLFGKRARQPQGRQAFEQLAKGAVGGVQCGIADLGEILDGREGVRRYQALLVGTVNVTAEGVHQAQCAALLAIGRHLQQGLGLQFIDDVVELLLLCLHGLAQGVPLVDRALQFSEVVAHTLQQLQLLGEHLAGVIDATALLQGAQHAFELFEDAPDT